MGWACVMVIAFLLACATKPEPRDTDRVEPDGDGDGFDAEAVGGDDCNDQDSRVHPEAEELCDGIDQNCDGDALAGSRCGETYGAPDVGVALFWEEYRGVSSSLIRDVTGDGLSDLFVSEVSPGYRTGVVAGHAVVSGQPSCNFDGASVEFDTTSIFSVEDRDFGDVDGDGYNDLGFTDSEGEGIFIHYGPLPEGERHAQTEADESWPSYMLDADATFSFSLTGVDLDGDGKADAAAQNNYWDSYYDWNRSHQLFFGGRGDRECSVTFDTEGVGQVESSDYITAVDVDGDGTKELGLGVALYMLEGDHIGGKWWVPGTDLRQLCETVVQDLAPPPHAHTSGASLSLDDWSGDGVPEIVELAQNPDEGEAALTFYDAHDYVFGESPEPIGSYLADEAAWGNDQAFHLINFDGEGQPEIIAYGDVFRGGEIPGPNEPLPERRLRRGGCAYITCNGDFDGDGFEDMVDHVQAGEDDTTTVYLLQGFAVPWDDPAYW